MANQNLRQPTSVSWWPKPPNSRLTPFKPIAVGVELAVRLDFALARPTRRSPAHAPAPKDRRSKLQAFLGRETRAWFGRYPEGLTAKSQCRSTRIGLTCRPEADSLGVCRRQVMEEPQSQR